MAIGRDRATKIASRRRAGACTEHERERYREAPPPWRRRVRYEDEYDDEPPVRRRARPARDDYAPPGVPYRGEPQRPERPRRERPRHDEPPVNQRVEDPQRRID